MSDEELLPGFQALYDSQWHGHSPQCGLWQDASAVEVTSSCQEEIMGLCLSDEPGGLAVRVAGMVDFQAAQTYRAEVIEELQHIQGMRQHGQSSRSQH